MTPDGKKYRVGAPSCHCRISVEGVYNIRFDRHRYAVIRCAYVTLIDSYAVASSFIRHLCAIHATLNGQFMRNTYALVAPNVFHQPTSAYLPRIYSFFRTPCMRGSITSQWNRRISNEKKLFMDIEVHISRVIIIILI